MRRLAALAALLALAGCNGDQVSGGSEGQSPPSAEERLNERLFGTVPIATAPVTQPFASRAAANFETETPVEVEVSEVGSRAALARLCAGEVTMAAVERPIQAGLRRVCRRNDIDILRIGIGRLAVSVVASSELGLDCMSLSELRRVWRPGSPVDRYRLYGAAPGSAAFELFTRTVNGKADRIRAGWTPIEDAARFGLRLADHERALAFVNREVLKPPPEGVEAVALDAGQGCTSPDLRAIRPGRYPLSRPLYLYVNRSALDALRVRSFARFTVENYRQLASTVRTIVPAAPAAVERSARQLPPALTPGG